MLQTKTQSKVIEITAVFVRERLRFDGSDTMVGEIRVVDSPEYEFGGFPCTVKGEAKDGELRDHGTYRFYGKWQRYVNRRTQVIENQFCFVSAVESLPLDRDSVVAYLVAKGKGNGIGRARAMQLTDKFGSDAVRVCREEPMVAVAAIKGWNEDDAIDFAAALEIDRFREVCHIELMGLLRGRGFPKKTADEAMRKWGNKASEIIKSDPYKLMAFRGCGFKRTDAMYLALGHNPRRMKRQALCVWYSLASDSSGDSWLPLEQVTNNLIRQIGSAADPLAAVKLAKRAKMIDAKLDANKKIWLAEMKKSAHEQKIVELLRFAAIDSVHWLDPEKLDARLSSHQREKLTAIFSDERQPVIWSLAGSPGTGKTFSGAAVIRELGTKHGWGSIAVCAPTGKAAVRITESLNEYKIPLNARTIHSTLGVGLPDDSGNWSFEHNKSNPLPVRFIVVDESSMIDAGLMSSLLSARAKGTGILFIGDINQLAPVGHGAPLRDMIAAGLPTAELTEIQRNSGRIVEACAAIRDGKRFEFSQNLNTDAGENLYLIPKSSSSAQVEAMQAALTGLSKKGFDQVWQCQVLTAVNRKSELARKELNRVLQSFLNHHQPISGCPFRVGDKIVNTKNKFFRALMSDETSEDLQTNEKGEVYVANGELAKVLEVDGGKIVAQLWNPDRTIEIYRSAERNDDGDSESEESDTGCTFDLGYALSVHKFQGSETPVAIVMLDQYPGAKLVCSREWIYTALSRAKKLCLCIGTKDTAYSMVGRQSLWKRKTFLKELIECHGKL